MTTLARPRSSARWAVYAIFLFWFLLVLPFSVAAAPQAELVMDARTGEILHSDNADTRLHPASLTKMMTLYVVFEAVERGEISLESVVKVSKKAASEPPSKLGLKPGQRIKLKFLIRAAAVKSANDAATALAEAISGSEAAFARRMTRTARALGMKRTTFKNAHGLTEKGHLSTARDMTILGRHLFYDFPDYYNLFSRQTTYAGVKSVSNTNRRLLSSYRGADGIKTGYTRAAGFNLVASAERGRERVIATVFGGQSSAARNAQVAKLLDLGFRRSPSRAAVRKPQRPIYAGNETSGKTVRRIVAVNRSPRPLPRPAAPILSADLVAEVARSDDARLQAGIEAAVAEVAISSVAKTVPRPAMRPSRTDLAVAEAKPLTPEIVTRVSTSGGRHWGINVGRYASRHAAEKVLVKMALSEMATLDGSLRKVVHTPRGFDANFLGLNRDMADLACRRLQAQNEPCFMIGPS